MKTEIGIVGMGAAAAAAAGYGKKMLSVDPPEIELALPGYFVGFAVVELLALDVGLSCSRARRKRRRWPRRTYPVIMGWR